MGSKPAARQSVPSLKPKIFSNNAEESGSDAEESVPAEEHFFFAEEDFTSSRKVLPWNMRTRMVKRIQANYAYVEQENPQDAQELLALSFFAGLIKIIHIN